MSLWERRDEMTIGEINPNTIQLTFYQVMKELVSLYREEGRSTKVDTECQGRKVDLVVDEGKSEPLYFKLMLSLPSDTRSIQSAWKRFDNLGFEWWLCVPDEEIDAFESLTSKMRLLHVNLCTWTLVENEEIGFFDLPDID